MANVGGNRVEFVGLRATDDPTAEELDLGSTTSRRATGGFLLAALLLLTGAAAIARQASSPVAAVAPSTSPAPTVATQLYGPVDLPLGFGTPRLLLVPGEGTDVVWVAGTGGTLARLEAGRAVASAALPDPVTALAVDPTGSVLYVATGGPAPTVSTLDAHTLTTDADVPVDRVMTSLSVHAGIVWAAGAGEVVGIAAARLAVVTTVALPGVTAVDRLVATQPPADYSVTEQGFPTTEILTVVATDAAGSHVAVITPATGQVEMSAAWPAPVSYVGSMAPLVAHDDGRGSVVLTPFDPDHLGITGADAGPLPRGSTVWAAPGRTVSWLAVTPGSNLLQCYDFDNQLAGRTALGDDGSAVVGPVVRAGTAVYGVTAARQLARGGVGTCS